MTDEQLDDDLGALDRSQLAAEVRRLRVGIREHRDASGQNLCWHHPELWGLLPEPLEPDVSVPPWSAFMRGCVRYRQSLDELDTTALRPEHVLDLAFHLRDKPGSVHVEVEPNEDPAEIGHLLVAVGYDVQKFRGFPVITASVVYGGVGARAWMGWLQVIERRDDDGTVELDVDVPPFLDGSPLFTYGYLPTFSDFPANPDHPDGDWVAHAYLVAAPDVVRTRRLGPVLAFRWGYRLVDGRPVERFAPSELPLDTWERHRPLLEREYPDWTFLPVDALNGR